MKRVAIVSTGYLWFPCEAGPSRLYRIARTFQQRGYEVHCITSDFQHFKKTTRDMDAIRQLQEPFTTEFLPVPPYRRNIGLQRIRSNHVAAGRVKAYLETQIGALDAVYVSVPPNDVAAAVTEVCVRHGVPVIVDIEDLWPEAMSMVVRNPGLGRVLFHSFMRDAERTYRNASAVVGTSADYTDRAFHNRKRNIPAITVYVGCDLDAFDEGARMYANTVVKEQDVFRVTYAGSISKSYDIRTLIDAGRLLQDENVRIEILGTGSQKESLEAYSEGMDHVRFHGYMPYPKMAAFLTASDVVVNSFIKGAPQSIVNKIGDYLASGRAMINTLENPVFSSLVTEEEVGVNVPPEDAEALAQAIRSLRDDPDKAARIGRNARALAERDFDRKNTYPRIVDLTDHLLKDAEGTER